MLVSLNAVGVRPDFYVVPRDHLAAVVWIGYRAWLAAPGRGGRRSGRRDLLPVVERLLEERSNDPEVITGAIQTFGIFGQTDEMLRATVIGCRVLGEIEQHLADRLGIAPDLIAQMPIYLAAERAAPARGFIHARTASTRETR